MPQAILTFNSRHADGKYIIGFKGAGSTPNAVMGTFDWVGTRWGPPRSSTTMEGRWNLVANAELIGLEITWS